MQSTLNRLRRHREEMGDETGFTLIELLIVIVILGVLAAIVVFAVQNLTSQSSKAACQSQYKTIETAAEAYKAQTGKVATDFGSLTGTASAIGGGSAGPWIKEAPTNTASIASADWYTINSATATATDYGSIQVGFSTGTVNNPADGSGNCS